MNDDFPYSDTVKRHFFDPQNVMKPCQIEKFAADGVGEIGSPACGDVMKIWIKVDRDADRIVDLRWRTFGCASAIGSTSALSEMVLRDGGMSIDDALKITPQKILEELGGLPAEKIHCSVLGDKALAAAIHDYFRKSGQTDRIEVEEVTTICGCLGVTDKEIEEAVLDGATTYEKVQQRTKAGTACGGCRGKIEDVIAATKKKFNLDD